jgi:uncharacterized protein YfdQ (DUF2303 family)
VNDEPFVPSDAQAIIDAARAIAVPVSLDPEAGPWTFVIPKDGRLEIPDLAAWRQHPMRKRGTYHPATVDALLDYIEMHHSAEATTIWIDQRAGMVEAVLNDNEQNEANWADHRALLELTPSPEWNYWTLNDQKMLTQEDFAEHLEGGLEEIIEPDGAQMLEIASSFHATSGATFRSAIRLSSGEQQLQYDETVTAGAGTRGDMTVPSRFMLALSPFVGEDPYKLVARLRFRVTGGTLRLGYWLDRPDRARRDALEQIAEQIKTRFPNVYAGTPAPPGQYR